MDDRTKPVSALTKADEKITDISQVFYQSARAEVIRRLSLRDTSLFVYIGLTGSYFGFIVNLHFQADLSAVEPALLAISMMPFPVLCFVFSMITLQHHAAIGGIISYVRTEIDFGKMHDSVSVHWDGSKSMEDMVNFLYAARLYAQAAVLCLPMFYQVVFFARFNELFCGTGRFWCGVSAAQSCVAIALTVFITYLHVSTHRLRHRQVTRGAVD